MPENNLIGSAASEPVKTISSIGWEFKSLILMATALKFKLLNEMSTYWLKNEYLI